MAGEILADDIREAARRLSLSPRRVASLTRKTLDVRHEDTSLEDLARNIKQRGLLQPITARRIGVWNFHHEEVPQPP